VISRGCVRKMSGIVNDSDAEVEWRLLAERRRSFPAFPGNPRWTFLVWIGLRRRGMQCRRV